MMVLQHQDTESWQNVAMIVALTDYEVRAATYFACLHTRDLDCFC